MLGDAAAVQSSVRGRYNVFISHAGEQKDVALWVRSHVRICGYWAFVDERYLRCAASVLFWCPRTSSWKRCVLVSVASLIRSWQAHAFCVHCRYGDVAPAEMASALRGASVVLFVVTKNVLCSKYCREELHWACEEMQRRSRQAQQGQEPAGSLTLVPVFYHAQDPIVGFGVDTFQSSELDALLREHHAAASPAKRIQWLAALMIVSKRTGIRQHSVGSCAQRYAL